jgi:hypothetical protein
VARHETGRPGVPHHVHLTASGAWSRSAQKQTGGIEPRTTALADTLAELRLVRRCEPPSDPDLHHAARSGTRSVEAHPAELACGRHAAAGNVMPPERPSRSCRRLDVGAKRLSRFVETQRLSRKAPRPHL